MGWQKTVTFTRERKKHPSGARTCTINIFIKLSLTDQCFHPQQVIVHNPKISFLPGGSLLPSHFWTPSTPQVLPAHIQVSLQSPPPKVTIPYPHTPSRLSFKQLTVHMGHVSSASSCMVPPHIQTYTEIKAIRERSNNQRLGGLKYSYRIGLHESLWIFKCASFKIHLNHYNFLQQQVPYFHTFSELFFFFKPEEAFPLVLVFWETVNFLAMLSMV